MKEQIFFTKERRKYKAKERMFKSSKIVNFQGNDKV